jgi:hypothetical protein
VCLFKRGDKKLIFVREFESNRGITSINAQNLPRRSFILINNKEVNDVVFSTQGSFKNLFILTASPPQNIFSKAVVKILLNSFEYFFLLKI